MMKRFFYFLPGVLIIAGVFQMYSCNKQSADNPRPIYKNRKKPEVVTNVRVVNFPGGADIIYNIPADPAILYVQADYKINSRDSLQGKASYYTDTLVVKGFEQSADYTVTLHTVSRSEVKSDPVVITVHPGIPPYLSVLNTLKIYGDFGGANIAFENPTNAELAIVALIDTTNKPSELYTEYTKDPAGNFSVRGFTEGTRKFGAYVRDRWGNTSDTVWAMVTSMKEIELDRSIMSALVLPGDQIACCGSSLNVPLQNSYAAGDWAFYGGVNPGDSVPARITIDMGKPVVLSRFRYWMRKNGAAEFRNGTLRYFKIYGSMNPNPNGALDDSWTEIGGVFELVKPSGLPYGQLNAADYDVVNNGAEFVMPLPAIRMRYFRLVILQNFSGGQGLEMASIKFMGDYQ